ncbi:DUF4328 domain-containing protein [Streptomyces sp. NPDC057445]|uniref:DUF4328 domain-containing protein n=1 Tax=Streptomyces sp. NPDC057445 TaxID=3346136 RepID=UPI00368898B3
MLCSNCSTHKATTGPGLCDGCAVAAGNTAPPLAAPPVAVSGPTPRLRSLAGLSYAVLALLGAVVVADLAGIAAAAYMRRVWAADVSARTRDELDRADLLMAVSGGLYGLALIGAGVLFIIWFHRARINAGVLAPDLQRRGPGWAIGGWFIPIGNLWIPRGIAGDVWNASRPVTGARWTSHALLNAWWAMWLLSLAVDRVAGKGYDAAQAPEAIRDGLRVLIVSDAIDLMAALLAIVVVRRVTAMQRARATADLVPVPV